MYARHTDRRREDTKEFAIRGCLAAVSSVRANLADESIGIARSYIYLTVVGEGIPH